MKTQNIIIAHPKTTEQVSVVVAFMEALKIKFEISKIDDSPYNSEFVAKIKQSKKEFETGKFIRVKQEDLQNFLGIE